MYTTLKDSYQGIILIPNFIVFKVQEQVDDVVKLCKESNGQCHFPVPRSTISETWTLREARCLLTQGCRKAAAAGPEGQARHRGPVRASVPVHTPAAHMPLRARRSRLQSKGLKSKKSF